MNARPPIEPIYEPPFHLSDGDTLNELWFKKLRPHYVEKLDSLRKQNDGRMSEEERHILLGRILEVKAFLELEEQEVPSEFLES